jgi:ATP-dependent Clp protease, protease subunit
MKKFWQLENSVDSSGSTLILEGPISSETWWGDEVTPQDFRNELKGINSNKLTVIVNSGGGDVWAGVSIHDALKEFDGEVTVKVSGVAASIASVIAMAGDKIVMTPGSSMMVHRASMLAMGNADEMQKAIDMLETVEEGIIAIYTDRTGQARETVVEQMNAETWMSAEKAVELGYADEVLTLAKDEQPLNAFSGNFAFSMSATKESLEDFASKFKAEAEAEAAAEVVEEENKSGEAETVVEAEVETVVKTEEAPKEKESEMAEEVKDDVVVEEAPKELTPEQRSAVEGIVAKALPVQPKAERKISDNEVRTNFVNQIGAMMSKNVSALKKFAAEGAELRGVQNAIADGESLWVDEVVRQDILKAYSQVGNVGTMVDRESIVADTLKIIVETAGTGFQPVVFPGNGTTDVKPTDTPVWTPITFEPYEWAVIVPWRDGDQKRTAINIYNQIVQYIGKEYAKLEDKIILTYAGQTIGTETRPASGLVPILTTANRDIQASSYDSAEVVGALATAYGQTESDGMITLVANRTTWAQLATSLDGFDRPLFTVVGQEVSAGALGSFNVKISSVMEDGDVVIGNMADYLVVTRGGLGTLFSNQAYIAGVINLFTQDASAIRADVDITGGVKRLESFSLIQFPAGS